MHVSAFATRKATNAGRTEPRPLGPMARRAIRRVRVALCRGLSVAAFPEFLQLIGMAMLALRRRCLRLWRYPVRIAMAGLAAYIHRAMNAGVRMRSFVDVAGRALHLRYFGGWEYSLMVVWQSVQPKAP